MKKAIVSGVLFASMTAAGIGFAAVDFSSNYIPTPSDDRLLDSIEQRVENFSDARLREINARIEKILSDLERHSRVEYLVHELYEIVQENLDENSNILDGLLSGFDNDDSDKEKKERDEVYIKLSDLPQKALDYIETNYPNATIEEAERENDDSIEVELSNDVEIEFDTYGNVLEIESEDDED